MQPQERGIWTSRLTQLTEIYQVTIHRRHALPHKHHVHENRDPLALRPAVWSQETLPVSMLRNDGHRSLILRDILLHRSFQLQPR